MALLSIYNIYTYGVRRESHRRDLGLNDQGERPSGPFRGTQHSLQVDGQVPSSLFSIISNPFEQKYRGIKTTNNTIKNKIMSLRGVNDLLLALGFVRESEEMFILRDERLPDFLEGEPSLD